MHYLFNLNLKQFIGLVNVYSGKTSYFSKAHVTSEKQQEQSFLFVKQTPCRLTHWALRRYKKQAQITHPLSVQAQGQFFPSSCAYTPEQAASVRIIDPTVLIPNCPAQGAWSCTLAQPVAVGPDAKQDQAGHPDQDWEMHFSPPWGGSCLMH